MENEGNIKSVEVGGVSYRYAQCNARTQRSIMFRLTKYGVAGMVEGTEDMGGAFIAGLLSRIPESEFNEICDALLAKCYVTGSTSPVALDSFGGTMPSYIKLVVEVLKGNFGDFTDLLSGSPSDG